MDDPSALARALAALRKRAEYRCARCGQPFVAQVRVDDDGEPIPRYCSSACRQRAHYRRHAERLKAERIERYRKRREGATDGG